MKIALFNQPRARDAQFLCLRLSFLLSASIPLNRSLAMLEETDGRIQPVVRSLRTDIERGKRLADGMRAARLWTEAQCQAISAGEQSGNLQASLSRLAEDMERARILKGKVVGALAYPCVVALAAMGLVVALTAIVFPKILPLIQGMHVDLPLSTRIVIVASATVRAFGLTTGAITLLVGIAWTFAARRSVYIRYVSAVLVLHVPITGGLLRRYYLARIARLSTALLEGGMPLPVALRAVADAQPNSVYKVALRESARCVERGQTLGGSLDLRLFPSLITQLISAGEASGSLTQTLSFAALYLEGEIDERTKAISSLVEPVLMITLGLVVGFVAVSIITPIYALTGKLGTR